VSTKLALPDCTCVPQGDVAGMDRMGIPTLLIPTSVPSRLVWDVSALQGCRATLPKRWLYEQKRLPYLATDGHHGFCSFAVICLGMQLDNFSNRFRLQWRKRKVQLTKRDPLLLCQDNPPNSILQCRRRYETRPPCPPACQRCRPGPDPDIEG